MAHKERAPQTRSPLRRAAVGALVALAVLPGAAEGKNKSAPGLHAVTEQASLPMEVTKPGLCEQGIRGATVRIQSAKHNPDTLRVRVESAPLPEVCSALGEKSIVAVLSEKKGKRFEPIIRTQTTIVSSEATRGTNVVRRLRTNPGVDICANPNSQFKLELTTDFEAYRNEIDPDKNIARRYSEFGSEGDNIFSNPYSSRDAIELTAVSDTPLFPRATGGEIFKPDC